MKSVTEKVGIKPWSVWRFDNDVVRVQIHEPSIAATFAKLKGVTLVGYSVAGGYLRLYHIKETVAWVDAWMKQFISREVKAAPVGVKQSKRALVSV